MGYRTNQCQHCGQYGHNRRGCPQIKEAYARVERLAEKYGIERSEDERAYTSTSWITRINEAAQAQDEEDDEVSWRDRWLWEEVADRKLAQARKNKRGRQCGFCGDHGHNARTCASKKQHRVDADAMQGLAHRVVAACLEKAGIVPGALMHMRQWNWSIDDYSKSYLILSHIDWEKVAEPGYDHQQGMPKNFDNWFRGRFLVAKDSDGKTHRFGMPRNIKQQAKGDYYEDGSKQEGLASPNLGGQVNKSSGWCGDNVTLIDPSVDGLFSWNKEEPLADAELTPLVLDLINEVHKWEAA
jgi:hypothetical protein